MDIPPILIDQLTERQVILFLGSGASIGAEHKDHKRTPDGQTLSNLIAEEFLGPDFKGRPLATIAELAISESDLFTVQDYIASISSNSFQPPFTNCSLNFPGERLQRLIMTWSLNGLMMPSRIDCSVLFLSRETVNAWSRNSAAALTFCI
jgi:hypothetical protein